MQYYQQQQRRVLALLDYALTGEVRHLHTIAEIDEWLLEQSKPDIFDDGHPDNVLTQARRRFGSLCAALAEKGYPRPQELTLFDFDSAVAYLNEKNSRQE